MTQRRCIHYYRLVNTQSDILYSVALKVHVYFKVYETVDVYTENMYGHISIYDIAYAFV